MIIETAGAKVEGTRIAEKALPLEASQIDVIGAFRVIYAQSCRARGTIVLWQ
jgi:hypothetical protein